MGSSTPDVLFCELTEDWQREHLENHLDASISCRFSDRTLQELPEDYPFEGSVVSVFIGSQCKPNVLERFPSLEFIATRSTGFDHVDLEYCEREDITVSNVPSYGDNTVAEHTFALILNLSRHVHEVVQRTKRGDFKFGGVRGFDLRDKTLGVIGTGHIGIHVIKMARGFGMNVLANDPREDDFMSELLDYEYVNFDSLMEQSDILTLHTPLNGSTRHLIDENALAKCKDSALIINTARGGIIDTEALNDALEDGTIAGAGLDVIEGEEMILSETKLNEKEFSRERLKQLVQNNQLLQRDDVIFTPHMAYNSKEAIERILTTTADNIRGFLNGESRNLVTGRDRAD